MRDPQLDRQQIHDVVLRYCQGIDRLDMELVRSAYHPDGVDHHTGFDGTVDEYVAWVGPQLAEHLTGTMHVMGNHRVELFGDDALAETYVTACTGGRRRLHDRRAVRRPPDVPRRPLGDRRALGGPGVAAAGGRRAEGRRRSRVPWPDGTGRTRSTYSATDSEKMPSDLRKLCRADRI